MKAIVLLLSLSLLVVSSTLAQGKRQGSQTTAQSSKQPDSTLAVDDILNKYVQAIGGREAVEKIKTQVATGSLTSEGGETTACKIFKKIPNKWFLGYGNDGQGFNGKIGWQKRSDGLSELGKDHAASAARILHIQRPTKFKDLFPKMVLKGKEKIGDREVYVIEATPAEGSLQNLYFDMKTGLLARETHRFDFGGAQLENVYDYDDYRDVDEVKVPFTMRSEGNDTWTIKFKEIKNNVPIDDAKFEKPSEQ